MGAQRGMTEEEFDIFYASAFPRLVGRVYAVTGDLAEAQDVVQEAFVRAWGRRRQMLADEAPEAWVRTVAVRLAVSRWRRARRWLELVRHHAAPEHVPGPGPEHTALVQALRRLPAPGTAHRDRSAPFVRPECGTGSFRDRRGRGNGEGPPVTRQGRARRASRPRAEQR